MNEIMYKLHPSTSAIFNYHPSLGAKLKMRVVTKILYKCTGYNLLKSH